jgi:hypothetical protein
VDVIVAQIGAPLGMLFAELEGLRHLEELSSGDRK